MKLIHNAVSPSQLNLRLPNCSTDYVTFSSTKIKRIGVIGDALRRRCITLSQRTQLLSHSGRSIILNSRRRCCRRSGNCRRRTPTLLLARVGRQGSKLDIRKLTSGCFSPHQCCSLVVELMCVLLLTMQLRFGKLYEIRYNSLGSGSDPSRRNQSPSDVIAREDHDVPCPVARSSSRHHCQLHSPDGFPWGQARSPPYVNHDANRHTTPQVLDPVISFCKSTLREEDIRNRQRVSSAD